MEFKSEEQKEIVLSDAKYKHINGCAGSRKTDTLIKCAKRFVEKHNRPVLFLTRVSSVTEEIKKRLKSELGTDMKRIKQTNNYIGKLNKTHIGVSNYDAWIHHMMKDKNTVPGDDFPAKKQQVFKELRECSQIKCTMKNGSEVGLLILDEAQDLQPTDMLVIIELSKKDPNLNIIIAGDYLQSIFGPNNSEEKSYAPPMNLFGNIHPSYFKLTKCFRCPKAHVDFNNFLMKDAQKKHGVSEMYTNNDNISDRPVLFAHRPMTKNTDVLKNAEIVCSMIKTLMENDETIEPKDIAVIMAKTNDSGFYLQLRHKLEELYTEKGKGSAVHHFQTNADGYSNTIDWKLAEGKTVLMSIHADKGRDHKAVFFLGFTEKSIPVVHQVFTPEEIQAESLANVATTRSTKYLFIGFTIQAPSRYLYKIRLELDPLVYLAWKIDPEAPDIYKKIMEKVNFIHEVNNPWPVNGDEYQCEELKVSKQPKLQVKAHISKDIERASDFVKYDWSNYKEIIFGKKYNLETPFTEEHYPLLGQMCELLIVRSLNMTKLIPYLQQFIEGRISFSKNDKLMSLVYDYGLNISNDTNIFARCKKEHSAFFSKNPNLKKEFEDLCNKGYPILHSTFDTENFRKDVKIFLSPKKNSQIKTSRLWNITLLYDQIMNSIYRPGIKAFVDYLNEDITMIHENIDNYCKYLSPSCIHNMRLGLKGEIDDKEKLKEMGFNKTEKKHEFGISGILDLFDIKTSTIHEIKASKLSKPSKEWIIQAGMYAALIDITPSISMSVDEYDQIKEVTTWYTAKSIIIVNILNGSMYIWQNLPELNMLDILYSSIQIKYNLHEYETDVLESRILKMNAWRNDDKDKELSNYETEY
jgi:hypothetical protein